MAIGALTIGATPGYARIGPLAPIIVVFGRLLQGLSAGVELGGVSVYLSEISTPGNRGFYCAWQSASQQLAVLFAGVLGILFTAFLPPTQMSAWGWRIPLLIGCAIIPLLLWFRRSLTETEAFQTRARRHTWTSALAETAQGWPRVLLGSSLVVLTTTAFYFITAYTPTFGKEVLHLSATRSMVVTALVGLSNFVWLPIGGALSDRIGRLPILVAMPVLFIALSGPLMLWLTAQPSFGRLIVLELAFSIAYALYNGAMVPRLVELMPAGARTPGFSLAYSLAAALFGGFTPAVSTWLIKALDNRAAPALWLTSGAVVSLIGAACIGWLGARRSREA
jgi:MFS family permease